MPLLEAGLLFLLLFPLPLKIAASMVGAQRTGLLTCIVAMFFAMFLAAFVSLFVLPMTHDLRLVGVSVFIAMSVAYWLVLRPSFVAAFVLSILAGVVQFVIIYALMLLGFLSLEALHRAVPQGILI